jgi:5-methylcytosine-specific restriction endonuclease McrA
MYLHNKYTIWYYNIINHAKNRIIGTYTERHHIIPRSLGGNNEKTNIVRLTGREHFICHWLLTKMTQGKFKSKMRYALRRMEHSSKDHQDGRYHTKITSKVFERNKIEWAKIHSEHMTGKTNWRKGIKFGPQTVEHRRKNSLANKGRRLGIPPGNKGKPQPEYIKDKKRKPKPLTTCPYCGKTGGISAMVRWHFDRCRSLIITERFKPRKP